jgi:hypothetical protein
VRQARAELERADLREAGVPVDEPDGFLAINPSGCAWPMVAFPILMALAVPWVVTQHAATGVHWGVSIFLDVVLVLLGLGIRWSNEDKAITP